MVFGLVIAVTRVWQRSKPIQLSKTWSRYAKLSDINIICGMKRGLLPKRGLNRVMLTTFLPCSVRINSTLLCNGTWSFYSWQLNGFRLNWRIGCYDWEVGLGTGKVEISNLFKDLLDIVTWCEPCLKLKASKHALLEVIVSNGSLNGCCLLPTLYCQSSGFLVGFWIAFKAESFVTLASWLPKCLLIIC